MLISYEDYTIVIERKMVNELMDAAFKSDEDFRYALGKAIKEGLEMSISDFSRESGIPCSTLYKIISGERDPNLRTLRKIVYAIRRAKGEEDKFIAVIAARPTLDRIAKRTAEVGGRLVTIKEYPATTMEEAIIAAVHAERDGAVAVVCAPIICPTIERILRIPLTSIVPKSSLEDAVELAVKKYL
jgi:predicted transcriptional regulator